MKEEKELPLFTNEYDEETGITFVFKRDENNTRILHIETHFNEDNEPMSIEDAVDIYKYGTFKREFRWKKLMLSETRLDDDFVWWFWIKKEEKILMIFSCFNKYKP